MTDAITAMLPVDAPVTGEYLDVTPPTWNKGHPHLGVDFGCPSGTPVRACTIRSKVHAVHRAGDGWGNGSFGTCIVADIPDTPWYFLYAHLSAVSVRVGDTMEPGDIPALSGGSGQNGPNTWAPHLHVQKSKSPDFPRDLKLTGDPMLMVPANAQEENPVPSTPSLTEDDVRAIVREELDARGFEANLAKALTDRIDAIHDAAASVDNFGEFRLALAAATDLDVLPPEADEDDTPG